MFWSVALPLPLPAYDFAAPPEHRVAVPVGCRVVVPWQGVPTLGLVVGEGAGGGRSRDALDLLGETPWVPPAFVEAALEHARASRLPLGLVLADLVPCGWDTPLTHEVAKVEGADLSPFGEDALRLSETLQDAARFDPALLERVRAQGLLLEHLRPRPRTRAVYVPAAGEGQLTPKQQVALRALERVGHVESLAEWAREAEVSTAVVGKVLNAGRAVLREVAAAEPELPASAGAARKGEEDVLELEPDAQVLTASPPHPLIPSSPQRLHGGSRRTRAAQLARCIRGALEGGGQVLYLAPDHAALERAWEALRDLAPALKFSGLLEGEVREHAWARVRAGDFAVVFGTPLALALPLERLSLLILEDEGSDAYKLQGGSRLFVPDLARRYAEARGVRLLFTGTVPAVESLTHPGEVLPPPRARVHVVNYALEPQQPELGPLSRTDLRPQGHGWPLSNDLKTALKQVADRSRQAALIAPRKGYSAVVKCVNCGYAPMCRNCDVRLRYSAETRSLSCGQCGYGETPPDLCPVCSSVVWQPKGPGTEWIVREVRALLPGFKVLRFDKDVQDDLSGVQEGQPAIVVGTPLLLSQPAPPDLALVGFTFADTWLSLSDFRAGERYHALLRETLEWHPSRAPLLIVQTFQADHPALKSVLEGKDAAAYPAHELELRREHHYPPFVRLAQLSLSAREQERAKAAAQEVAAHLFEKGALEGEVLGPAPAAVARVKGMYGYTLLLRARDDARLEQLLGLVSRSWPAKLRIDSSPRSFVGL